MPFGYERRDVDRISVRDFARASETAERSRGLDRHARDRLRRASPSIRLNIVERNG
jgi:hypothetical protein